MNRCYFICPDVRPLIGNYSCPIPGSWGGLSIIVASEPSTHSYGRKPLPVHGDGLAPLWSSISIRFAVRMEDMEKAKDIPTSLPTHAPKEQINLKEPVLFITPY